MSARGSASRRIARRTVPSTYPPARRFLLLQIRSSRLGPSQPGELAAGRESKDQAPPFGESYAVRPAKVTQPSLVGGRAVRASAAQTPLVELYRVQWRARADTGCRVSQRLACMDACATSLSDKTSTSKRRQRNDL